jgi:pimeloyl-ACP methyl ester carboxylesterase
LDPARREPFRFESRPGAVLRGDIWTPGVPKDGADAGLVICHGFKGFKDWGFFPFASRTLATRLGCPVVSFNFTGSGIGDDLESFSECEAFGHNTFSRECGDLDAVLDGLAEGRLGASSFKAISRIGVLGHSRGGVATILSAERPEVVAIATWAAIASPMRYAALFEGVEPGAAVEITNARTGDVLPLFPDVLLDLQANRQRFDLDASLMRSRVPLLVVHGSEDSSVPVEDGRHLAAAGVDATLEIIEGAGHTFEVGHPFMGPSPELTAALSLTGDHFERHLR